MYYENKTSSALGNYLKIAYTFSLLKRTCQLATMIIDRILTNLPEKLDSSDLA